MKIIDVISELEKFDGDYKRNQVEYALQHQKEITPYLIKILQSVIKDPLKYSQKKNYFGHVYSLILLGYFKDIQAHKLLIELFCLPENNIIDLYGFSAYEDFKGALYQTCGGSIEQIKELALNKKAPVSTRNSATSALLYAVIDGISTREDTLKFLSSLFKGNETEKPSEFWSNVACDICDLCPDDDAYEIIKKAYANNLIDDGIVGFEEFQEAIDLGVKASLDNIRQDKKLRLPDDMHEKMSSWACFGDDY